MRKFVCAAIVLAFCVTGLMADEKPAVKGKHTPTMATVKKVDAEKGTLTVTTKGGEEKEFQIADETLFRLKVGEETKEMKGKEGLKCESLKEGAAVTVFTDADGKVVKVMTGAANMHHKKGEEHKHNKEEKKGDK